MPKSWTVEVEQAPDGEFFIQLTDEMLEETGFKIGDELDWVDLKNGSFQLVKKAKQSKYVLVDAVSTFRMRYVVEVPGDHNDGDYPCSAEQWAMDTVSCEEAKEFSQEHLGEQIVSAREVTREEVLSICDVDNNYCSSWDDDKKIEVFVTEHGFKRES
jgi:hypothetical protein